MALCVHSASLCVLQTPIFFNFYFNVSQFSWRFTSSVLNEALLKVNPL